MLNGVLPLYCPISQGQGQSELYVFTYIWSQRHFTITQKYLILTQVNKYAFFVKRVS